MNLETLHAPKVNYQSGFAKEFATEAQWCEPPSWA